MLRSNLTYFRLRRDLFADFVAAMDPPNPVNPVVLREEIFLVIRYFLTARNESLDDNKRLSFDKAIMELRAAAVAALRPAPPEAPAAGGLGRFLGLGQ